MTPYDHWKAILRIQKFRRIASYTGFYCFVAVLSYAYTSNTTRAGISRADQFYASYPAGTEMLTDTAKLYKAALANCFEEEEWGPIEFSIMTKHFERQGKPPYAYHSRSWWVGRVLHCSFHPPWADLDRKKNDTVVKDHLKTWPFHNHERCFGARPVKCKERIGNDCPGTVISINNNPFLQYMAHLLSHGQLDGSGT